MQLLVIEDNPAVRNQIQRMVDPSAHVVAWSVDAREALEAIGRMQVDLLLAKQTLPAPNALYLCSKVRQLKLERPIYILLACGQETRTECQKALAAGADDILNLPFSPDELQHKLFIAQRILHLEQALNQKLLVLKRNFYQTIQTLAQMMTLYHPALAEHNARVGTLALTIAKQHPDVTPDEYPVIEAAGMLHDIGFVGLPLSMLKKRRTELAGDEPGFYRSHAERGERILTQLDLMRPVARLVRSHHEQFNGRGFPDGLAGEQIPVGARIVAAASLYDDLVHREKVTLEKAPEILQQYRGYQLEPVMVALLIDLNLNRQQEENRREDRDVFIEDLAAGMVLGRDILMKSGAFLMAAGTRIDAGIVQKLKRYHQMGNISAKVFIRK